MFLKGHEVARRINRTPGMVRWLADHGRLKVAAKTLDGTRLYLATDVDEYLATRGSK